MIEIYAVKLNKVLDEQLFHRFMFHLSEDKLNRIKKFRKRQDAIRTLVGDMLVRINACNKLGIMNKDIIFEKNKYGKPYLKGFDNFYFNISHSSEWVVCAISSRPIGIDVEEIKPIKIEIAERFYSEYELNELSKREGSHRLELFFDFWTLRESYVKAVGKGLYIPFSSFSFKISEHNEVELIKDDQQIQYYFKRYHIDKNYKMSVCSSINDFTEDIIFKELDQTFDNILLK